MTKARVDSLISTYKNMLLAAGVHPQQPDITKPLSRDEMLGHCLWVLEEKLEPVLHRMVVSRRRHDLLSCNGFQGTGLALGLCTIADTRRHANEAGLTTWQQILDED